MVALYSILTNILFFYIKIPCSNTNCHYTNNVPTGKRHGELARTWDVNSKLANGNLFNNVYRQPDHIPVTSFWNNHVIYLCHQFLS